MFKLGLKVWDWTVLVFVTEMSGSGTSGTEMSRHDFPYLDSKLSNQNSNHLNQNHIVENFLTNTCKLDVPGIQKISNGKRQIQQHFPRSSQRSFSRCLRQMSHGMRRNLKEMDGIPKTLIGWRETTDLFKELISVLASSNLSGNSWYISPTCWVLIS